MKKLILIGLMILGLMGCDNSVAVGNKIINKPSIDTNNFRWLIKGEVIQSYDGSSSSYIIKFNEIYGKEYKIISMDAHSGVLCVQKR